jgi:hypothetical protein
LRLFGGLNLNYCFDTPIPQRGEFGKKRLNEVLDFGVLVGWILPAGLPGRRISLQFRRGSLAVLYRGCRVDSVLLLSLFAGCDFQPDIFHRKKKQGWEKMKTA